MDRPPPKPKPKPKKLSRVAKLYIWLDNTPLEKFLEDIERLLDRSAFFSILGRLGNLAVVIAVITFVYGENTRRNNEVYAAWQTITSAEGQPGSGGRIEALEFLNSRPWRFPWIYGWHGEEWIWNQKVAKCESQNIYGLRWDRQPLDGLPATNNAYLANVKLCGAKLTNANLEDSNFWYAHLGGSKLGGANLQRSKLIYANLESAILHKADLTGANLGASNLTGAELDNANLEQAFINIPVANGGIKTPAKFIEATKITPQQIKSACNWEQAIYKAKWNNESNTLIAHEPFNQNYIELLKQDQSTDPAKPANCRIWSNGTKLSHKTPIETN